MSENFIKFIIFICFQVSYDQPLPEDDRTAIQHLYGNGMEDEQDNKVKVSVTNFPPAQNPINE